MGAPEPEATQTTTQPGRGLAIASLTIDASGRAPATLTALLALSGAAVFATTSWDRTGPPIDYLDTGTSGLR